MKRLFDLNTFIMNELIKISESDGKKAVSAKELYEALGFDNKNWSRWAKKNICDNQFAIPSEDYVGFFFEKNGNETQDFALSLDFAKKLCMLARTVAGEKIRRYFVEIEKQVKSINLPKTYKEALQALLEEVEAKELAEAKVKELEPKAEIYDSISNAENLLSLNDAAKTIGKLGRNAMMKILREKCILRANNTPYQQFIDSAYFVVKVKPIKIGETETNYTQTFVTGKGLTWLTKILNNNNCIK